MAGFNETPNAVMTINQQPQISFIFDPANTDYTQFKKDINDETAQLQDAEGATMTAAEAKSYIATLP
jgi:hypothetical protein